MNAFSLLIYPMAVGFLAVVILNVARYWLIHQTGYWFLLPVLMIGTALQYVADMGLTALEQILDLERSSWRYGLGSTTFWATILAVLMPSFANVAIGRRRAARLAAKWRGNLIECLMHDSNDSRSFVELTLETGKSFVGLVAESGVATPNESDVSIIPIFSGYRDCKHRLQLTTSYRAAILKVPPEDDNLYQFEVVLPKSQTVFARRFDVEVFAELFGRPLPEPASLDVDSAHRPRENDSQRFASATSTPLRSA